MCWSLILNSIGRLFRTQIHITATNTECIMLQSQALREMGETLSSARDLCQQAQYATGLALYHGALARLRPFVKAMTKMAARQPWLQMQIELENEVGLITDYVDLIQAFKIPPGQAQHPGMDGGRGRPGSRPGGGDDSASSRWGVVPPESRKLAMPPPQSRSNVLERAASLHGCRRVEMLARTHALDSTADAEGDQGSRCVGTVVAAACRSSKPKRSRRRWRHARWEGSAAMGRRQCQQQGQQVRATNHADCAQCSRILTLMDYDQSSSEVRRQGESTSRLRSTNTRRRTEEAACCGWQSEGTKEQFESQRQWKRKVRKKRCRKRGQQAIWVNACVELG